MCPISFHIYGKKLSKGRFSFGTGIIFKSHLNSLPLLLFKQRKMLSDLHIFCLISLIFPCVHFCNETERCQLRESLKYFSTLRPAKNDVRSLKERKSDLFPFFGLFLVIKQ